MHFDSYFTYWLTDIMQEWLETSVTFLRILFGFSLDSELKSNQKEQVELEHLGRDQLELRPQHNGRIYVRSHFSLSPIVH